MLKFLNQQYSKMNGNNLCLSLSLNKLQFEFISLRSYLTLEQASNVEILESTRDEMDENNFFPFLYYESR